MRETPIKLPAFCYPKRNPGHPCPCEDRPVEMTHKRCVIFWQVEEGALLRQGDTVAEAEADKKTVVLPAPAAGRLVRRCVQHGDTVAFEDVIGYVEGEG